MPGDSKFGVKAVAEEVIEPVPLVNSISSWSNTIASIRRSLPPIPEDPMAPVPLLNVTYPSNTMPKPSTPRLTTIPEELIDRIVSSLDKPALTHLSHTCKLLSRIANPHLWSTLHLVLSFNSLPKPKRLALVKYLTDNPLLASHIRDLHIKCKGPRIYPEFWLPWFATLLAALPNLESFVFTDGFGKRSVPDYPLQQMLSPLQAVAGGKLQRLDLDYDREPLALETALFTLPISHLHIRRAALPKTPPPAINPLPQSPITHLSLSDFPPGVKRLGRSGTPGSYNLSWDRTHTCPHLLSLGDIFLHLTSFSFLVAEKDSLPEFYARNMVQIVEKSLARHTLRSLTLGGRASPAGYAPAKGGQDPAVGAMRVLRRGSKIEVLDIYAGSLQEEGRFDLELPGTVKRLTLRKVESVYDKVLAELRLLSSQGVRTRFPSLERITVCGSWGDVEVQPVRMTTGRLPFRVGDDDHLVVDCQEGGGVAEMRKESDVVGCFEGLREEYAEQGVRLDFVREECVEVGFPLHELDQVMQAVMMGRPGGSRTPRWLFDSFEG